MSVTFEVTIWCEGCMIWETRGGMTPDSLRDLLLTHGWTNIYGKDYCGKCAPHELEKQRKEEDALIERIGRGEIK